VLEMLKHVEKKCYICKIDVIKKKNGEDLSGGGRLSVEKKRKYSFDVYVLIL
jgi:hypothetical protein